MSEFDATWRLAAHHRAELEADPRVLEAALAMSPLLSVEGAHAGRVRVWTRGVVGTMQVGPLRVVVSPRHLSRAVALGLVLSARGLQLRAVPGDRAEDLDMIRVLGLVFLDEVARLFQRGLRREYKDTLMRPDPLRGELDLERWHGPKDPEGGGSPWCRVRERTSDLPEHRLLHAALRGMARAEVLEAPLRRRAAALAERLSDVPTAAPPRSSWARLRRVGPFAPYAIAIDIAGVLLDGLLGEGGHATEGRSFLLDLDRLFERWIAHQIGRIAPEGWRVECQDQVSISTPQLHRALDVSIRDDRGDLVAILDAKNKAFDAGVPPRDDVHQLVTYMATLRCPFGALVGLQADGAPASGEYTLRGGVGRVHVARLPGRGGMEELAASLVAWSRVLGPAWMSPSSAASDATVR